MENKETFEYNYAAMEQNEVKKIREKYLPKEENKMEQLRKLDQSVVKSGTIAAIVLGIIGSLILGVGMCCVTVWAQKLFVVGIIIGVLGIAILGMAYPVYVKKTKKEREKIAPQILALSEELMK